MISRGAHNFLALLLAAFTNVALAPASRADAFDGILEVRSAYATVEQGSLFLFTRVAYPVNDDIRAALKDGLTLTFDLDIVVSRERRFWMAETVLDKTLRRELSYHAVSDKYLTRDANGSSAEQHSFATLEEALDALGTVDALPILASLQLSPNREYRIALRAGVRRGRLSDTLRVMLFWTDDWHRESEWFSWSLQR